MFGGQSRRCGVDHICETLPLLHAASMKAMIRQYPTGDDLLDNMLGDMNHWVMEQVTSVPANMDQASKRPSLATKFRSAAPSEDRS